MANIQKYNSGQCKQLFNHYERKINDKGEYLKFSNQEIDTSKTYFNYNLHNNNLNQNEILKKRLSEVKCLNRSDVNIMCSWVITKPLEIDFDEQEKFFKESYNFLSQKYGQDNIISSYVHLDETTPHMHFSFIPVVKDKKKDILKVSAKELINKNHLSKFHIEFSEYMKKSFNRDIGVINGVTKAIGGNKTVEELKEGKVKEIEYLKEIKRRIENEINILVEENQYSALRQNLLNQKEILSKVKKPTVLNKNYSVPSNIFEHILKQCNQSYATEKIIDDIMTQAGNDIAEKDKTIKTLEYNLSSLNLDFDILKRNLEDTSSELNLLKTNNDKEKEELKKSNDSEMDEFKEKYKAVYDDLLEKHKKLVEKYNDFEDTIKSDATLKELFIIQQNEKYNERDNDLEI